MKTEEETIRDVAERYSRLKWSMDERACRLWAGNEAISLGHGGGVAVAKATGLARQTISRGILEIKNKARHGPSPLPPGNVRRPGAGQKKASKKYPNILKDLESLVEPVTRGDPMSPLRWTTKSLRTLSDELKAMGYKVSHVTVGELLGLLNYSLQGNAKVKEGKAAKNNDRDPQFNFINDRADKSLQEGIPVLSVDTKKKELIGEFKNPGRTWNPKGSPTPVNDHDFPEDAGKVAPYGVYDIHRKEGWVNVGTDHDTATFAVESLRRWWSLRGKELYPDCPEIFVTADGGGSNGSRSRLWKKELQALADEIGRPIRVSHFPPGTSKWNKIEHQLFSQISMNWKGIPLTSHEVVVNLIANTRTKTGLKVHAVLDSNKYPTGTVVSEEELKDINIKRADFRGDWNYVISPKSSKC